MTIEYLFRTLLILFTLLATGYYGIKIRKLVNWAKHEELFDSPIPGVRLIPCSVMSSIMRYAGIILVLLTLMAVLEYGWIVYRYVSPPTPTEYFAYTLKSISPVEK